MFLLSETNIRTSKRVSRPFCTYSPQTKSPPYNLIVFNMLKIYQRISRKLKRYTTQKQHIPINQYLSPIVLILHI
jgi:hypothetical protein